MSFDLLVAGGAAKGSSHAADLLLPHLAKRVAVLHLSARARSCRVLSPGRARVLWTSQPTVDPILRTVNADCLVYFRQAKQAALGHDREIVARADLVLTGSDAAAMGLPAGKTRRLRSQVDDDRSRGATPAALPRDGRPIAGFIGTLDAGVDQEALLAAATVLPDWQFVQFGLVRTDVSRLRMQPNVELCGPISPLQVVRYLKALDVALLPVQGRPEGDRQAREILACGTPLVALDGAVSEPLSRAALIAQGGHHFARAIRDAQAWSRRRSILIQKTIADVAWADRARDAERVIEAHLFARSARLRAA